MEREQQNLSRTVSAMKKNGKLWMILGGIVIGVLLLVFGGEMKTIFGADSAQNPDNRAEGGDGDLRLLSMEEYRIATEARIKAICERVAGAGEVHVILHLAGGYEYVYATDEKISPSGEVREYIMIGSGSNERVVYLTERVPEILGIGIVCDGGDREGVRNEMTALLSATLGVGSHRVYVTAGS